MKIVAHVAILSVTFITLFLILAANLAVFVGMLSFVFWTIPSMPSMDTVYCTLRVLTALSTIITVAYSFSTDYKQYVQEYLGS